MPFVSQPPEKCEACGRTVYATEKTTVDEKDSKKIYHKTCIRCDVCNKVLSLGTYQSMDGKFWCKPHFKQLFSVKGNYDEAFGKEKATSKWDSSASSTGGSFVPETQVDQQQGEKKQTSEATLAKFRKFREEGQANDCSVCAKAVYMAERLIVEDKDGKRLFHQNCFKCTVCQLKLDLRNYGSSEGMIYCKNHLKEVTRTDKSTNAYVSSGSFVPETKGEEKTSVEKKQTPDHITAHFRSNTASEKCESCGKIVYPIERIVIEELNSPHIYHKNCLRCTQCEIKLDVHNYGQVSGKLYCKAHLKSHAISDMVKSDTAYFVSPLARGTENYQPGPADDGQTRFVEESREEQSIDRPQSRNSDQNERPSSRTEEILEQVEDIPKELEEPPRQLDPEEEEQLRRQKKREEKQRQMEEEQRLQEEESRRKKEEREKRLQSSGGDGTSDESGREEERRKRREEREKQRLDEEKLYKEEKEKREKEREERRKQREAELS